MKKLLLGGGILICVILGGLSVYKKLNTDRSAPEIGFAGAGVYVSGMTEEALLAGVTATDPEEGDVSDSLVVEAVVENPTDNTVIVVYAARDSENNIAKVRRVLSMAESLKTDQDEETEPETEKKQTGSKTAVSGRTGNAVTKVESESETDFGAEVESESEIEPVSETESEYESEYEYVSPGSPVIKLTANKATIKTGEEFNPLAYVKSIEDDYDNIYSLWRDIQIEGEYDVNKAGTYEFAFYVTDSSGNRSNTAHFKLTVKP